MNEAIFFPDSSLFLLPPLDIVNASYRPPMGCVSPRLKRPDSARVRRVEKTQALYTASPAGLALSLQRKKDGGGGGGGGGGDK